MNLGGNNCVVTVIIVIVIVLHRRSLSSSSELLSVVVEVVAIVTAIADVDAVTTQEKEVVVDSDTPSAHSCYLYTRCRRHL